MPNDLEQRLGDKHQLPPPLYFLPPPPPRRADVADATPDGVGIATRLHPRDIGTQVARRRTKALATVDSGDDNALRDRLVAVRASERIGRERLRKGLPAHRVISA